jgi:hypothetical protein
MKENVIKAVEDYQCSGCVCGSNTTCFEQNDAEGIGCGKHCAGTMLIPGIGLIYLGMPKGFNRLGEYRKMQPVIFESFEEADEPYNKFNIPVWKYLSPQGHTFVRGLRPRRNEPFIHIFLENCIGVISCLEITESDIMDMD